MYPVARIMASSLLWRWPISTSFSTRSGSCFPSRAGAGDGVYPGSLRRSPSFSHFLSLSLRPSPLHSFVRLRAWIASRRRVLSAFDISDKSRSPPQMNRVHRPFGRRDGKYRMCWYIDNKSAQMMGCEFSLLERRSDKGKQAYPFPKSSLTD